MEANRQSPEIETIIKQYEQLTAVSEVILGGNLHVGYWPDGDRGSGSMREATDRLTDLLAEELDARPGQRILDAGCGTGRPALRLARTRRVDLLGVDISPGHVKQTTDHAREEGLSDQVTAEQADVMDLPFPDASFDAAWAVESLPHVPDRVRALGEIRRVLRPGGRVVFTICVERRPVSAPVREFLTDYYDTVNATYPPLASVPGMVVDAGLELVRLTDIGENIFSTMARVKEGFDEAAEDLESSVGLPRERTEKIARYALRFGELPESGYAVVVARRPVTWSSVEPG
ncbi:SAM-dependent methyltransferase [Nocardiopsis aegyptia]|uniref:27-O-demethylrifamycin SV methyltransferase n=1 Tax=Nocardiopsis aegyptia TaxID=220378 RepID=A0A7Z0JCS3_9ACTN|nr:class I SAM-dependent methyltransferase [Nocardiopsis aegyptia]NYJ37758.1 27-O-demethylrifamycin SV methyltransferase [Nocardiopsis aegyptia]